jgi:hypothetical protein
MMKNHDEIREALGAYALDAVDEREGAEIERHLSGCEGCRAEVTEHREMVARLAEVDLPPPAGVWERIQKSIHAEAESEAAPAVPLRPSRLQRIVAGLAAAAVLLVAFLSWRVYELDHRLDRSRTDSVLAAATAALADPDAERLVLRSSDGEFLVDAVVLPDGSGFLIQDNLRALSESRTYQLWGIVRGTAISAGVLGNDPDVTPFKIDANTQCLLITEEIAGGVAVSRNLPIVAADLAGDDAVSCSAS